MRSGAEAGMQRPGRAPDGEVVPRRRAHQHAVPAARALQVRGRRGARAARHELDESAVVLDDKLWLYLN